ncbi:DUF5667 domain-containing protein [Clostridium sp. DJ247]|uniref:DUF5667 domain-containing protein n=1 Tax=Clostridium sp. DJ247 TaxID=2726188 RepID=UPI001628E657|nr:DUF5667 domain-containing protein [Clostridium sp. DJ247]MBC2581119.1 hypothetical protein [Clostridium sp. DJ247]
MKKIGLFVTALVVSLNLGGKVFADTTSATLADKAGITPDNIIVYPMDKALDNLKISMASGDDKKAEALADVAEERLGESEVMAEKGKTGLSNEIINEYNDKITEAQEKVADAIDKASNGTTDSAIKLDELKNLEITIADKQLKSIEVLKNIENKVSGNAKETISQVIEMQTRKKEAIAAVIKERQILLQTKKAVKEAEKSLEQAKKAGDEQAIKTAEDTLKQAQQALNTENEKFSQVVEAKKQAMKGGVGQLKKQAKKDKKEQAKDAANTTTSEDTNTTTGTSPALNNETTTTNTAANTDTNTNTNTNTNTTSTNTDTDTTTSTNTADVTTENTVNNHTTVTNNSKADTVKENKGQEMKASKENNKENGNKDKH